MIETDSWPSAMMLRWAAPESHSNRGLQWLQRGVLEHTPKSDVMWLKLPPVPFAHGSLPEARADLEAPSVSSGPPPASTGHWILCSESGPEHYHKSLGYLSGPPPMVSYVLLPALQLGLK